MTRQDKIQGLIDKINNGAIGGAVDIVLTDKEALHISREVSLSVK